MNDQSELTYMLLLQRKPTAIFIRMVVASLILHIAFSFIFLLPGRYSGETAGPIFVEMVRMPANVLPEPSTESEEPPTQASPEVTSGGGAQTAPEMAKLQRIIENSLDQAATAPEKIHESSIGLGMTSGYFGSFAEGETLKDDIREYYFSLMRRINEVWWMNARTSSRFGRSASINIRITREGKIAAIEFIEGSGDTEYDRLLLESLKKAEPLPPLPRNFPQRIFSAPVRFIPPLNLMLPQFTRKTPLPHGAN